MERRIKIPPEYNEKRIVKVIVKRLEEEFGNGFHLKSKFEKTISHRKTVRRTTGKKQGTSKSRGKKQNKSKSLDDSLTVEENEEICAALLCRQPKGDQVDWVQCDGCESWFHFHCIGITKDDINEDVNYMCGQCCPVTELILKEENIDFSLENSIDIDPLSCSAKKDEESQDIKEENSIDIDPLSCSIKTVEEFRDIKETSGETRFKRNKDYSPTMLATVFQRAGMQRGMSSYKTRWWLTLKLVWSAPQNTSSITFWPHLV